MGAFAEDPLAGMLEGNERHVHSLRRDAFHGLEDEQHPDVVTVCCADSRVPQERMWGIEDPGTLFTPSTIGNQAWDIRGDEHVVDGGIAYAVYHTDVETVAIVGHTGCGAIAAAYEAVQSGELPGPHGVDLWIEQLIPVVDSALKADIIAGVSDDRAIINRLVEWNVDAQVKFLLDDNELPSSTDIFGFVYDFQGAYGDVPGRCYLVNYDGVTDSDRIADNLPQKYSHLAKRLTS